METAAEIVAKKVWHKGDAATAQDLFDLSLVIEKNPESLQTAGHYRARHANHFLKQLYEREAILKNQFDQIDFLEYRPSFEKARESGERFLSNL